MITLFQARVILAIEAVKCRQIADSGEYPKADYASVEAIETITDAEIEAVLPKVEPVALTEEMIKAPRDLILYAETPGRTWEGAREHMRLSGCSIDCWPEWAKHQTGHLTKSGIAILVWHMMQAAAPVRDKK